MLESCKTILTWVLQRRTLSTKYSMKILTPLYERLRGTTVLDKDAFKLTIKVPYIVVPLQRLKTLRSKLKPFKFSAPGLKLPVVVDSNESDDKKICKKIFLDPDYFSSDENLMKFLNDPDLINISKSVNYEELNLTYDNFNLHQILSVIIPDDLPDKTLNRRGFKVIGHIIQYNLRKEIDAYKYLIGKVTLDKLPYARTVINKKNDIENAYRTVDIEVIAGESDFLVTCKENGCIFKFDFSKVYWNPSLGTEHERIVNLIKPNEIVCDVCSGVGPFSIPLVLKGCDVHANDLNPECIRWLQINKEKNTNSLLKKGKCGNLQTYNKDGKAFISENVNDLIMNSSKNTTVHIIMNLPETAIDFLSAFYPLLYLREPFDCNVLIYCYAFSSEIDARRILSERVFNALSVDNNDEDVNLDFYLVRSVSPNKKMFCINFKLNDVLLSLKKKTTNGK